MIGHGVKTWRLALVIVVLVNDRSIDDVVSFPDTDRVFKLRQSLDYVHRVHQDQQRFRSHEQLSLIAEVEALSELLGLDQPSDRDSNPLGERFPKPFIAMRASRRTELEQSGRFANHVLNDWIGHSGAIAETHYLQTTEEDYAQATVAPLGDLVGQCVGQSTGATDASTATKNQKKPLPGPIDGSRSGFQYTPQDSNL